METFTKTIKITPECAIKLWKHQTEKNLSPVSIITLKTKTDIFIQDVVGKGLCLIIKGLKPNVLQAIDQIINLKNDIDNKNTKIKKISLDIDNRDIGFVIGCGGKTIKLISERTGCELSTTRGNEHTPAKVHIQGDNIAKIERAKELVWGAANEALRRRKEVESFNLHISPRCFVEIEPRDIGFVIGFGGKTIQMIAERTGCFLNHERATGNKPAKIYIEGPNQMCVENAKQFIFDVAQESYKRRMIIKPTVIPSGKFNPMDAILPAGALTDGIECYDKINDCIKIIKFDTKTNKYIEKPKLHNIIETQELEFEVISENTTDDEDDDDDEDEEDEVNVIININTNTNTLDTTEDLCWSDM